MVCIGITIIALGPELCLSRFMEPVVANSYRTLLAFRALNRLSVLSGVQTFGRSREILS